MTLKEKIKKEVLNSSDPQSPSNLITIFQKYRNVITYPVFRCHLVECGILVPKDVNAFLKMAKARPVRKTMFEHSLEFIEYQRVFRHCELETHLRKRIKNFQKAHNSVIKRLIEEGHLVRVKRGVYKTLDNSQKMTA